MPDLEPGGGSLSRTRDTLGAGRDAWSRHAWKDALDLLAEADGQGTLGPEDLEALAESAWWNGRLDACIETRERAYRAHLEAGNVRRAGYLALRLVDDNEKKLQSSVAAGWLKRAVRHLRDAPEGAEHGYLILAQSIASFRKGNIDEAIRLDDVAMEIGERYGDRDLVARAILDRGYNLVVKGEVAEGMSDIEESCATAVGGELSPHATYIVFCGMIATSRDLADLGRAGEWTEVATRWCERQAIKGLPGVCRVHRAEIMRLRGALADAEQEATRAADELRDFNLRATGDAFHELGEIRLRVGDLEGADAAFRQARELGSDPQPGLAMLLLARGEIEAAAAAIRGSLEADWEPLARAQLLPAQVEIAVAAKDLGTARESVEELDRTAAAYGTPALQAAAAHAAGLVRLAEGTPVEARERLRTAVRLWQEVSAPYEAARARMALAETHLAEGDLAAAALEVEPSRAAFDRLGAEHELRRASELMERTARRTGAEARAVATFMFTDIVGSTALIQAIGDDAWQNLRGWHDEALRTRFASHAGEEIDHAGDGFFVAFPDAGSAIVCAIDIQRSLAEHRRTHGFAPQVRIGIHAAEATRTGGGYSGKGVHTAARIGALATGGEILATTGTTDGVEGVATSAPRDVELKGLSDPQVLVAIDWR